MARWSFGFWRGWEEKDLLAVLAEVRERAQRHGLERMEASARSSLAKLHWSRHRVTEAAHELEGLIAESVDNCVRADALTGLALIQEMRGHPEKAMRMLKSAIQALKACGSDAMMATATRFLASSQLLCGRFDEAYASHVRSVAATERNGRHPGLMNTYLRAAHMAYAMGKRSEAWEYQRKATRFAREIGFEPPFIDGDPRVCHAWLSLADGHLDAAVDAFEEITRDGRHHWSGELLRRLGVARLATGDGAGARETLHDAVEEPLSHSDRMVAKLFIALSHCLDRDAQAAAEVVREVMNTTQSLDDRGSSVLTVVRLAERMNGSAEEARRVRREIEVPPSGPMHMDARVARDIVDRWLRRSEFVLGPRPVLHVSDNLSWLEVPGHARLELRRRPRARILLEALVQQHRRKPGVPLTADELFERVWPDDRSSRRSLSNRLWVAVSKLRRLGLHEVLVTEGDGYLLAPRLLLEERAA